MWAPNMGFLIWSSLFQENPRQQPHACTMISGPKHGSLRHSRWWSRAPIMVATVAATGDLPQQQPTGDLPQWLWGPPTAATGISHSGHGDLPQWPWGPPITAMGTSHNSHGGPATGHLPQQPRGTSHSSHRGTSHSGHGGTSHSGHRGPPTVAMGTYHSSHREEVGVVAALLQVHHDVKQ